MAILKFRDANGEIHEIFAIRGEPGEDYVLTDDDKTEIANSVTDSITPASIGAVPSGFGCAEQSAKGQEWNSHYRNGFYKNVTNGPDGENLWYGISCVSSYGEVTNLAFNANTTSVLLWQCVDIREPHQMFGNT